MGNQGAFNASPDVETSQCFATVLFTGYLKSSYSNTPSNSLDCISVTFHFPKVGRRCCLHIIPPMFFCMCFLAVNLQKWSTSVKTVARTKPNVLIRRMQQVPQIILDSCSALDSLRVVRPSQYRSLSCSRSFVMAYF